MKTFLKPIVSMLAVASLLAAGVTNSVACGVLALVLLLATMLNHLAPTRFIINSDGIGVRGVLRSRLLKWSRMVV